MNRTEEYKKYYEANKESIRAKTKKWYAENKERALANSKAWAQRNGTKVSVSKKKWKDANREAVRLSDKEYRAANREKRRVALQAWRGANIEKAREKSRRASAKRLNTPKGKLSSNISREIRASINRNAKGRRHWETLVDFTIDQLKAHIEKLFKPGMNWENYGTAWHIDHKIPVAVHNFERPEDIDFRLCWSLKNLQPMEKLKNISKGAKIEEPFQPSLAIGVR